MIRESEGDLKKIAKEFKEECNFSRYLQYLPWMEALMSES